MATAHRKPSAARPRVLPDDWEVRVGEGIRARVYSPAFPDGLDPSDDRVPSIVRDAARRHVQTEEDARRRPLPASMIVHPTLAQTFGISDQQAAGYRNAECLIVLGRLEIVRRHCLDALELLDELDPDPNLPGFLPDDSPLRDWAALYDDLENVILNRFPALSAGLARELMRANPNHRVDPAAE